MRSLLVAALLASSALLAAEPAVPVQVEVVQASLKPGPVPESLKKMQTALSARIKYGSLKIRSTKQLMLSKTTETIELPNKSQAVLSLERLKDGVATVQVQVPPASATYTLAKDKSLYFQAGSHDGDDVWLVLSQPK